MKLTVTKRRLPPQTSRTLALIVAGLLLGLSLAVRWQGQPPPANDASTARERAAQGISELEREQEQLKATLAELRGKLASVQRQASQTTALLAQISADLERERMAAGLVALRGPGVIVQLDDSAMAANAVGPAAQDYIIHEYDLRDVVNLLWNGGAEAVAINDERLVNTTSIYCVGSTIMVNDTRLSPPYQIRAIGDRKQMGPLLENPAFLAGIRQKAKTYGIEFKISWADSVDIPAFSGTFRLRYANAGEVKP